MYWYNPTPQQISLYILSTEKLRISANMNDLSNKRSVLISILYNFRNRGAFMELIGKS